MLFLLVVSGTTALVCSLFSDVGRRVEHSLQVCCRLQRESGEPQHWDRDLRRDGEKTFTSRGKHKGWIYIIPYYESKTNVNFLDYYLWAKRVCRWWEFCTCWLSEMIINNQLIWINQQTTSTGRRGGGTGSDIIRDDRSRKGVIGGDRDSRCLGKVSCVRSRWLVQCKPQKGQGGKFIASQESEEGEEEHGFKESIDWKGEISGSEGMDAGGEEEHGFKDSIDWKGAISGSESLDAGGEEEGRVKKGQVLFFEDL